MARLKKIETNSTDYEKKLVNQGFNTLTNTKLKFTFADRTDLTSRPQANLFASFNLPITEDQQSKFLVNGDYYVTAFQYFNKDKIIVVEIPKSEYGELIDGKTIKLTIPYLSGGTQSATLYSTFFTNIKSAVVQGDVLNELLVPDSSNPGVTNTTLSDTKEESEEFGARVLSQNGFNSNVAYLYSDLIATPKTAGKTTWANSNYKFTPTGSTSKATAIYSATALSGVDVPVGIAYLDKGFIVITDEFLVNNFAYNLGISSGYDSIASGTTYTGGQEFTQIYFTGSTASCEFRSYSTEYIQNVICLALPGEFYESNNPTWQEAFADELDDENKPVYITEIGLYNDFEELIAIAKLPEPIRKTKSSLTQFNIQIKI